MVKLWGFSDLHLCISKPKKNMGRVFPEWINYVERIRSNWNNSVSNEDIVLVPGDVCWASKLEDAIEDLEFIDSLNGKKIISPGNHDFWWSTQSRLNSLDLRSITFLRNNIMKIGEDTEIIALKFTDDLKILPDFLKEKFDEKRYKKELNKLHDCLKKLDKMSKNKILMMHYPPVNKYCTNTDANRLMRKHGIDICLFGHIHDKDANLFSSLPESPVKYVLVSADYLKFSPKLILEELD